MAKEYRGRCNYRVGILTNSSGSSTSRIEIARWLMNQVELDMEERKWMGKMPAISRYNAG
jgi:hypothetical protein